MARTARRVSAGLPRGRAQPGLAQPIQGNTDRPGLDYTNVTLPPGSVPKACRALCDADGTCQSWTFVKAGIQSANPCCWIKDTVPAAEASNCCTSGVKNP